MNRLFEVRLDRPLGLGVVDHGFPQPTQEDGEDQRRRALARPQTGASSLEDLARAELSASRFLRKRRPRRRRCRARLRSARAPARCRQLVDSRSVASWAASPPPARSPSTPAPAPAAAAAWRRRAGRSGRSARRPARRTRSPARTSASLWRTRLVEASGIAIATIAQRRGDAGADAPGDRQPRLRRAAAVSTAGRAEQQRRDRQHRDLPHPVERRGEAEDAERRRARRRAAAAPRAGPRGQPSAAADSTQRGTRAAGAGRRSRAHPGSAGRGNGRRALFRRRSPSRAHQYSKVPEPVPISGAVAFSLTADAQNWYRLSPATLPSRAVPSPGLPPP